MASEHPAEKDICVLFVFHSDGCIELNLSKQQESPNKGWEVFPLQKPCKVHFCLLEFYKCYKNGILEDLKSTCSVYGNLCDCFVW